MTSKLKRFEKFCNLASNWLNWITIAGLIVMALITAVDVIGAKLFNAPLIWSYEVTALMGSLVLVFALAFTQFNRGHIEIEFVTTRFPKRTQAFISSTAAILGMALFAVMTWQMVDYALTLQRTGRVTSIQEIPMAPFAYGAAFCFLVVFLVLLLQLLKALAGETRK